MKSFALVCFVFAALFLVQVQSASCYTIENIDVSFCKMMVGQQVDPTFNTVLWNGQNYFGYMDGAIEQIYNQVVAQIGSIASKNGFSVCEDCKTQYKYFLCAGAFVKCGLVDCILNSFSGILYQYCPQMCKCKNCDPIYALNCTAGDNPSYDPTDTTNCDFVGMGQAFLNNFNSCNSYMLAKSHCETFVNVCGCNFGNSLSMCDFLSTSGYTISSWPTTGSCASTPGWCSSQSGSTNMCPNENLCMNLPPLAASQAITVNPAGTPQGNTISSSAYTSTVSDPKDPTTGGGSGNGNGNGNGSGNGNGNGNGSGNNSSSSFTIPSSVLLFGALLAALFF